MPAMQSGYGFGFFFSKQNQYFIMENKMDVVTCMQTW